MSSILDTIQSPADLKALSIKELESLAAEIRENLVAVTRANGGHLASNLGAVELTLALHYVFDAPEDKIIFDVGHQSYVHKILTGRRESFATLRKKDGISGFPKREESEFDAFNTGHASTSVSAGLGFCHARDLANEKYHVVSVIGDGALTGGMAMEALNDAGSQKTKMILVLNDNGMSISRNVGGMSRYLSRVRSNRALMKIKRGIARFFEKIPLLGKVFLGIGRMFKRVFKRLFVNGILFENMGWKYIGPIDGHNIKQLVRYLKSCKEADRPVILHAVTKKGKGYEDAENAPEFFHGVSRDFNAGSVSMSDAAGETLCELAKQDEKIVAVTAAMMDGTGLTAFAQCHPDRFFDVGIAEQHATTMCAGLAAGGFKPYFFVYASFLQRSFDQLAHDVALQKLPVTFCVDRAGLVGGDGETHNGVLDLSFFLSVPNLTVVAPRDNDELKEMLAMSVCFDGPLVIRYPKCAPVSFGSKEPFKLGKWEILAEGEGGAILAFGNRNLRLALDARAEIEKLGKVPPKVINASSLKPMDEELLQTLSKMPIVTLEDNVLSGGFGSSVRTKLPEADITSFGIPDVFVSQGEISEQMEMVGLTKEEIVCHFVRRAEE